MPELPEVETIKKDLEKKIIGKKIIGVKIIQKKSIKNSPNKFIKALKNNYAVSIGRKGKLLILELNDKNYLLAHLRMTGQLVYRLELSIHAQNAPAGEQAFARLHFEEEVRDNHTRAIPPRRSLSSEDCGEKSRNKHTRVILCFEDRSRLYFNDLRRFGYLQIASGKEKDKITEKMGVDALCESFNLEILKKLFKDKKKTLKSLLLDQKIIAGIGNIYADEICFDAKLDPRRKVNELNDKKLQRLYNSIRKILASAIKHRGTTFSDYIDANGRKGNFAKFLKVYGREKENCKNCGKKSIQKIKLAGRATRFCGNCQR